MSEALVAPNPTLRERGPPKKRRRIVVSCTECHRRKQKCDRDLPCANCRSRNKASACTYEAGAPTAKDRPSGSPTSPTSSPPDQQQVRQKTVNPHQQNGGGRPVDETLSSMAAAFGYSQTGASTMSFLKRIEAADDGNVSATTGPAGASSSSLSSLDSPVVRERYKGLIRQLPAKNYLDKLIDLFMLRFNWYYGSIDPDVFYRQLDEWNRMPFKVLSSLGPMGLSPDLRVFPAVLFQVVATALLIVSEDPASEMSALKYAGSMSFTDLADDYSESGVAILALLGKRTLTITHVVAQFLRASFLKFTAHVTESWHAISMAIRDAQDLGMHRDVLDPKPANSSAESALENQWLIQTRRKLWATLLIWDINMAVILGRPGCIDWRREQASLPVDVAAPSDRSRTPVVQRDEDREPPTPIIRTLWGYKLAMLLREILELEQDGPCPKDFSKVNRVQEKIMELDDQKPAILRVENPDTRWDGSVHWITESRHGYAALHKLSILALHRPYIFHRKESRRQALEASIKMLELQRASFGDLPRDSWTNYHLFFGSFDAIVIIASIFILFPNEYPEYRQAAVQQLFWTSERFSAMQERNPLARSAQGVIRTIQAKVIKAIGHDTTPPASSLDSAPSSKTNTITNYDTPATTTTRGTNGSATPPASSSTNQGPGDNPASLAPSLSASVGSMDPTTASASAGVDPSATDWSVDMLANIAPMYPTSDLIFNDLSGIPDSMMGVVGDSQLLPMGDMDAMAMPWQFGGGFGDDAVWQYLNQLYPGTTSSGGQDR